MSKKIPQTELEQFLIDAIADFQNNDFDGCYFKQLNFENYFKTCKCDGGELLHFVLGWQRVSDYFDANDEELKSAILDKSGKFVLCGKIAYNCDDLQSDYDWDWYFPCFANDGDCWIYENMINKNENIESLAKNILRENCLIKKSGIMKKYYND